MTQLKTFNLQVVITIFCVFPTVVSCYTNVAYSTRRGHKLNMLLDTYTHTMQSKRRGYPNEGVVSFKPV